MFVDPVVVAKIVVVDVGAGVWVIVDVELDRVVEVVEVVEVLDVVVGPSKEQRNKIDLSWDLGLGLW